MSDSSVFLTYDPDRLLDALSTWLGAHSDRMLSRMLRLSPQILRGIRTGSLPLRASILITMAEGAGKGVDELRRVLGDRRCKARMSRRAWQANI
ncbi:MAG TPA: hypothetical protein VEC01_08255 [Noviherbaspirillum sp.]|uniref:hypothetical protein n=1 Tax=Noviherbaspirillum sp. TaxID=1926288 RepID=UPI002D5A3819|nr:hypothetical protein [Noviherbaspirillum sp.]HYD95303.1 hypothetical protein [Noviherbaspirillum sp.]